MNTEATLTSKLIIHACSSPLFAMYSLGDYENKVAPVNISCGFKMCRYQAADP